MIKYYLSILLFLLPTYTIRFSFFGFNTNLLMISGFVLIGWFACYLVSTKKVFDFVRFACKDKKILALVFMFFVSGLFATFYPNFQVSKLGQFIVLFLQPMLHYFAVRFLNKQNVVDKDMLVRHLFIFVAGLGVFAILQYCFLFSLEPLYWGNSVSPRRATALWPHPNDYALFVLPFLLFLLPYIVNYFKNNYKYKLLSLAFYLLGLVGLFLSQSRVGLLVYLLLFGIFALFNLSKKIIFALFLTFLLCVGLISFTDFKWRFITPFYGDGAVGERAVLFKTGLSMVKESPLLGFGLQGFGNEFYNYYSTDTGNISTHYNSPHNWFLHFWIDTGIFGLISITFIIFLAVYRSFKVRFFAVAFALLAIFLHGQLDTAYLKNDLAIVFWLLVALL